MRVDNIDEKETETMKALRTALPSGIIGQMTIKELRRKKRFYNTCLNSTEISESMVRNLKRLMGNIYRYLEREVDEKGMIKVQMDHLIEYEYDTVMIYAENKCTYHGKQRNYWYSKYADGMIMACRELNADLTSRDLEEIEEQEILADAIEEDKIDRIEVDWSNTDDFTLYPEYDYSRD